MGLLQLLNPTEVLMNRFLSVLTLLLVSAVPLLAQDQPQAAPAPTVVADVMRMSQAGVDEEAILAYINKNQGQYLVSPDEIITMTQAGLSKNVIDATVNASDWRNGHPDQRGVRAEEPVRERSTTVVVSPPYYPYYGPSYDPWWYMPRFYLGFGWGSGGYYGHGGHYTGGGRYGGGGHGGHGGGGHGGGHR